MGILVEKELFDDVDIVKINKVIYGIDGCSFGLRINKRVRIIRDDESFGSVIKKILEENKKD